MSELLTGDELAYMRETQAEARPTTLSLQRIRYARGPGGERTELPLGEPELVQARIWDTPDEVPQVLADRFDGGTLVKLSVDVVPDVRSGDELTAPTGARYELVSDGEPDAWATAQLLWARRLDRPGRA